jgi:hypothetical protein
MADEPAAMKEVAGRSAAFFALYAGRIVLPG